MKQILNHELIKVPFHKLWLYFENLSNGHQIWFIYSVIRFWSNDPDSVLLNKDKSCTKQSLHALSKKWDAKTAATGQCRPTMKISKNYQHFEMVLYKYLELRALVADPKPWLNHFLFLISKVFPNGFYQRRCEGYFLFKILLGPVTSKKVKYFFV